MMKIFLTFVTFLFAANSAFALDFGDTLRQIGKDSGKEISANLDKKLDKILQKYEGKIDAYKKDLDKEISGYKAKIEEAKKSLNMLERIKNKAQSYIKTAKIILAVLSSGILILIFIMWRIWKNVVTLKKVVKNVASYNEVEKRLKVLEKKAGVK